MYSPIVISRDIIGLLCVSDSQRDFYGDGQLLELELSGDVGVTFFLDHEDAEETRIQLQEIASQRIVLAHHTTSKGKEGNCECPLIVPKNFQARSRWNNERFHMSRNPTNEDLASGSD